MTDPITQKWFWRGFVLSALLVVTALLVVPVLGQAGGLGNPNATNPPDQPGQIWDSDGPAPAEVHYGAPMPNDAPQTSRASGYMPGLTDNPSGLQPGPVVFGAPVPNDVQEPVPASGAGRVEPLRPEGYSSPLVIPAADFRSDGIDPTYYNFWFATGAAEGVNPTTSGCMMAPAYLPNNATIVDVWASVYDNNGSYNVPLSLRRVENYTGAVNTIATLTSAGASTTIQSLYATSISNTVVSYPNYSYYATACVRSTETKLYSVRIYYTP